MRIWRETFLSALIHVVLIVLITLLIVRWSIAGPIARTANWIKALRTGRSVSARIKPVDMELFRPLAREVATMAEVSNTARSAAEREARLRDNAESIWTADRLAVHVQSRLADGRLFVVSNREPYTHVQKGKSIEVNVPASGLVTALEPVLRAAVDLGRAWIRRRRHGDGGARTIDCWFRRTIRTIRCVACGCRRKKRKAITTGLPTKGFGRFVILRTLVLCFAPTDWNHYQEVNRKFAEALSKKWTGHNQPGGAGAGLPLCAAAEDDKRAQARRAIGDLLAHSVAESGGVRDMSMAEELIDGLLGADLVAFHIQAHCSNFLQTVDRIVESRIDWDHSTVQRLDHGQPVRPFPISVKSADPQPKLLESAYEEGRLYSESLRVRAALMGVGCGPTGLHQGDSREISPP